MRNKSTAAWWTSLSGDRTVVMALEVDGFLWKPKPGTTVTAEEFARARSVMQHIHQTVKWNPWVQEDRAEEYAAALEVIGQWTRAEPDYRPQPPEELRSTIDQQLAEDRARLDAERERAQQDRAERAARYDRERDEARLALLGQLAILAGKTGEREQLASGERYPAMEDERRQEELAKLDLYIKAVARAVDELTRVVGDAEAVWYEHGWLPSERRALSLEIFAEDRVNEIRELRGRVAAQQPDPNTASGQSRRTPIGEALLRDTARLRFLEAIPPLDAADMCSECPTPAVWHSLAVTFNLDPSKDVGRVDGPCPAWPWWREWVEEARRQILALAEHKGEPPVAVRRPIAVIDSGLPIEEVIARLSAVQVDHPGTQVRQREQLGDLAARRSVVTAGIRTVLERPRAAAPVRSPSRTGRSQDGVSPGSAVSPGIQPAQLDTGRAGRNQDAGRAAIVMKRGIVKQPGTAWSLGRSFYQP